MAEASMEMIERVVRKVLAELGVAPATDACSASPAATERKAPAAPANPRKEDNGFVPAATDLVINRRVVTLAEMPEQLNGFRRVLVPSKAVVTPAVRDELQRKNVALEFASLEPSTRADSQSVRLIAMGSRYDPAQLVQALEHDGFGVQVDRMECLIAATDKLAGELVGGRVAAVLLTRHPSVALCLANRHGGVRAILGAKPGAIVADAEAVGANLLVLDPSSHGFFPIKRMTTEFVRGGPRQCPEVFCKQLG